VHNSPISASNKILIAIAALVALVVAFSQAGASSGVLTYRLLTDGVLSLAWVGAMTGLGWGVVRKFPLPMLLRLVSAAAIGVGIVSFIVLGLGLIGWLNALAAWAVLLIGIGLAGAWIWAGRKSFSGSVAANPWRWLWLLLMPFLGLAIVGAIAPPGLLWQDEPAGYDVTEYHLQVPREWYEVGKITGLHHNVFSYMPMNVEMHDLLAMHLRGGPWAGMYLAQFIHLAIMILAVLAVAGMAAALSDKPWAGPLAGVAMGVVPWITSLAPIAYNEGGLMLFGGLAVGWVLLAKDWRAWLIAGVLAGFACGVKLTAGPMVAGAVVVAWLIVWSVRAVLRAPQAEPLKCLPGLGVFIVACVIVFSPWMVRNLVWVKNPVFPEAMEVLGKGHFSDVQVERWRLAHSPRAGETKVGERLKIAWQRIVTDWRYGFVFLPLVLAAMVMRRDWRMAFVALVILVQLIVWIGFTHLQGRFFILVIPPGAMLIGMVRAKAWPWLAGGGILVVAVAGFVVLIGRYQLLRGPAEKGGLGVENLTWMIPVPTEIDIEKLPTDRPIILAGDAQAFLYSGIPMKRLHYQTVFDVPGDDGADWLSKWTHGEHGTVLVFPGELLRLKKSYYSVPAPSITELEGRAPYLTNK
jgi:hypothetical protein